MIIRKSEHIYKSRSFTHLQVWSIQLCSHIQEIHCEFRPSDDQGNCKISNSTGVELSSCWVHVEFMTVQIKKKTSCLEAESLFTLKRTEGAGQKDRWDQNDVVWSKSARTPQTNSQRGGGEVMICAPCSHLVRHEFLCVPKYARV